MTSAVAEREGNSNDGTRIETLVRKNLLYFVCPCQADSNDILGGI